MLKVLDHLEEWLITFLIGGGIGLAKALRHGRVVNGSRRREQWRRTVELARELGNDPHVLLPDADLHGRVAIVIASHHRSANLEHARRAGTIAQYLDHRGRVEPRGHAARPSRPRPPRAPRPALSTCSRSPPGRAGRDREDERVGGRGGEVQLLGLAHVQQCRLSHPMPGPREREKILVAANLLSGAIDATFIGPNPAINGFVKSGGDALRIVSGAR